MRESTKAPPRQLKLDHEDLIAGGRLANCLCTTAKPINDGCKHFITIYITLDGATVHIIARGFLQGAWKSPASSWFFHESLLIRGKIMTRQRTPLSNAPFAGTG